MKLINMVLVILSAPTRLCSSCSGLCSRKANCSGCKTEQSAYDATCGRKCKSVIVVENNHVILSAISCEAIQNRTDESEENKDEH